ncbi:MAG: hypothetical protein LBT43_00545 [Prevotella sp.]|nr:hypothetical protein [Prevotella sp.]
MSKIVIAQDDIFTDSCVKRIEEEYYASIHSNEYFDLLEDVEFDAANFIQSDNNIYIAIGEFIRYAKEYNYEACARIVASDELNNDYLDFAKNMQTAISLRELRAAEWAAKIDSYKLNVDFFIAFVLLIVLTLHIVSKRTKKTKK